MSPETCEKGAVAEHDGHVAPAPLLALFQRYREAIALFNDASDRSDELIPDRSSPEYLQADADWRRYAKEEARVLMAICTYPTTTIEEARARAEFLLPYSHSGRDDLQEIHIEAILRSFLPVEDPRHGK